MWQVGPSVLRFTHGFERWIDNDTNNDANINQTSDAMKTRHSKYDTIRYDTIGEFNVDSKAEYSALSSTRSQKKKPKQTTPVPL